MDLIRDLLRQVEEADTPLRLDRQEEDPAKLDRRLYHVQLLSEAGLVVAYPSEADNCEGLMSAKIERLTWEGHEFLEATKDESIWQRVKQKIAGKGGAMVFEIAKELAISLLRQQGGLTP